MRRKARRNRQPVVLLASIGGGLLLLALFVGLFFALRGNKNRSGDGGLDALLGGDAKKNPNTTGDEGNAARRAGWVKCPNPDQAGFELWMPKSPSTAWLWPFRQEWPGPNTFNNIVAAETGGRGEALFSHKDEKTQDFYFGGGRRLNWIVPRADRARLIHKMGVEKRDYGKSQARNNGTFGEVTDYTQDGHPAVEITFSDQGTDGSGAIRFIHAGDRVFYVYASGPTVVSGGTLKTFFDSFKVTYRSDDDGEDTQVAAKSPKPNTDWEPEWQSVAGADGFEAMMPGRATKSGTAWTWSRGGEVFEVAYHTGKTLEELMKELGPIPHPKAAPLGLQHMFTTGPVPAAPGERYAIVEFHIPRNAFTRGWVKYYTAGDRTYTITVAVREGHRSEKIKRFTDSFKLTYRPGQSAPPAKSK